MAMTTKGLSHVNPWFVFTIFPLVCSRFDLVSVVVNYLMDLRLVTPVVTPPVGINLFAVLGAVGGQADFRHVALGVIPFIFFDLIVLALLIIFPALATWLPQQMIQG